MRLILTSAIVILVSGCVSYGGPPPERSEGQAAISAAIGEQEILIAQRAAWIPNRLGFNQLRSTIGGPEPPLGTFVLTDKEVVFLAWHDDSSSFVRAKRIFRSDINEVIVDSYGRARRLVITTNAGIDTFELADGAFIDAEATERARVILQNQLDQKQP